MALSRFKNTTVKNGLSKSQSLWDKQSYTSIVKDGLLVHLDAGISSSYPGSGSTWFDISGNSHNFTIQNSVPYVSTTPGYFEFTRTSSHHMTNTTLANYNWSNGFTVGVWHRNPSSPDLTFYRGVINNGIVGDRNGGFDLRYGRESFTGGTQNGTALGFNLTAAGGAGGASADFYSANGTWAYFAVTYNNTHMVGYKNGNSFFSRDVPGTSMKVMSGGVTIGISPGTSESLDGRLSHVHIYNRALSKDEMLANFNAIKGRHGL